MKRHDSSKDLIVLLGFTIFTAVVWVGFDVYRALNKVVPPTGVEEYLTPLNPTLKLSVFTNLNERTQ